MKTQKPFTCKILITLSLMLIAQLAIAAGDRQLHFIPLERPVTEKSLTMPASTDTQDEAYQQKLLKLNDEQRRQAGANRFSSEIRQKQGVTLPFAPNPLSWRGQQSSFLTGEWIFWGNGENGNSLGAEGLIDWNVAQRFTPTDLESYAGYAVTKINFIPADVSEFTVKIWQGNNPPTLVYAQEVTSYELNAMNTIDLVEAVPIDVSQDLWVGYRVFNDLESFVFPAAVDSGPAVAGKGDMIQFDGEGEWFSLFNQFSLDMNWLVQAFVELSADADAPGAPANLLVEAGGQGALEATVSWNNPSTTFGGDPLGELDLVSVFRNGALIHTITDPQPGAAESFFDTSIAADGIAVYSVIGENFAGNGLSATAQAFVGEDVPEAPASLLVTAVEEGALLTWDAPTAGLNGGFLSGESIVYDLVRMPGEVQIAESFTETSFTDASIPGPGNYFYRVTARNHKGTGGIATSNTLFITPEGIAAVVIGDGDFLTGMPYDFFWEHSIAQTLYFADEIGLPGAVITGLQYQHVFNADALDKDIMIWLGETNQNSLQGGYIDPASLQLVFDGKLDFLANETEVMITLDSPYTYSGGNLVVYSMKADNVWSSGKNFKNTMDDPNVIRSAKSRRDFTPYDPLNPGQPDYFLSDFPNITIFFSDDGFGALQGTVADGANPLGGVKVTVLETNSLTHTNANGFFQFAALPPGNYDVLFTKFGYEDLLLENVIIVEDESTEVSVSMNALPAYSVNGTVTGNNELPIEGAMVSLTGNTNHTTQTDVSGFFGFTDVFEGTYTLMVTASGYTPWIDENFEVAADVDIDVIINEILLNPGGLKIVLDDDNPGDALFSWSTGADAEFRYDNGTPEFSLGIFDANYNVVIGAAHRNIAELFEMSWMMPDDAGMVPSDEVKVWVFGLDEAGNPDQNTVIYSQENVTNVPGEWNTHVFSQPVLAPNGFLIGISAMGDLVIVTDSGDDPDWPFIPETQFFNFDVTASSFSPIEIAGFEWNFFIRANGIDLGETSQQQAQDFPRNATGFNVFLNDANVAFVEEGEYLFSGLEEGLYTAGVQSVYETGTSEIVTIDFEMLYPVAVTLNVSTNTGQSPEGAVVELTGIDIPGGPVYTGVAGPDGVILFPSVKKGSYVLEVSLENHNSFINDALLIDQDLELNIELSEATDAPFNLTVVTDGLEAGQALLTWNNPSQGWAETFDSGQLPDGWTQIITNTGTNAGLPTTWHVTGTVPFYSSSIVPRTGDYQVFMMWDFQQQDEWLITPGFTAPAGDLTFWYHGVTGSTFGDNYYVKISTDGGSSWTVLWNASVLPPSQNYYQSPVTIDLTPYAGQEIHIAWHNEDGPNNFGMWYMWAIDDITIGEIAIDPRDLLVGYGTGGDTLANAQPIGAGSAKQAQAGTLAVNGFNIFLNGSLVAEGVSDTQYLFAQLNDGEYTAGVQAVYTTGVSEIVEKDFIIHENNLLALVAQPAGSGMLGGSAWYPAGVEVPVFAIPNNGFAFLNWTDTQGNVVSEEPAFIYTMPNNDVILIANFEDFETFNLTFYVDMSNLDWLNFDHDMVNVTGSMHGWAVLGENARDQSMMRVDNSHTFKISFKLPPGEYSYAYFLNEGAHNHEWEHDVPVREIVLDANKEVHDVWGEVVTSVELIDVDDFRAYPNPFTTHINISGADWATHVVITDVLGNRVLEAPLTGGRMDTGGLRPGMYLLQLRGDDGRQAVQRIIKQ